MCIELVEIWFWIAIGQVICLPHDSGRVLSFPVIIYREWLYSLYC